MDNILQGSLKHFSVSELLHFLIGGGKTGTLNLNEEGKSTWIYVSSGELVYAFSSQEQFRLGTLLQRRKKISKAQRQQLDDLMLKEGEKFTHAALASNLFKPEQLQDFLKNQVSEILFDVMGWKNGNFSMTDTVNAPSMAVPISIDLPAIMAEGEMKNEEWQRCVEKLPDTATVFRVIGDPETQGKITLSVDQWKVLFKVDGERTLADLVREAEEDPIQVYRVVFDLLQNGLIEETPEHERPAGGGAPAEQKPRPQAAPAPETQPLAAIVIPEPARPEEKPPLKLELDHSAPTPAPAPAPAKPEPVAEPAMPRTAIEIPQPPRVAAPEPPPIHIPEPPPVHIPEPPAPPPVEIPRVEAKQPEEKPQPVEEAPKPPRAPMPEPEATVMEAKVSVEDMLVASLTLDTADRTSFPLYEPEYVIGRDAANPIHIPDGSVSSVHARVFQGSGGYIIEDLKSRNGTYVNGERVERKLLQENDKIRLGKVLLTYNVAAEMRPAMATMFETPRPS